MKYLLLALSLVTLPVVATAQDAEAGEKVFGKCKACHMIDDGNQVIAKGGRVGPNLYKVIGRQAGSLQDFNYGPGMQEVFVKQIIWDEAALIEYLKNPTEWVAKMSEDKNAKSKMTFKLTDAKQAADVAAYLKSIGE